VEKRRKDCKLARSGEDKMLHYGAVKTDVEDKEEMRPQQKEEEGLAKLRKLRELTQFKGRTRRRERERRRSSGTPIQL
jgi:hypothetical protein